MDSLPHNPPRDVRRVLAHFELPEEQEVSPFCEPYLKTTNKLSQIVISSMSPVSLPVDKPVNLSEVLSGYVELSQPATTRDLTTLTKAATADATREELASLMSTYPEKVLAKRLSVLEILEAHKDIKLSLGSFLQMLPAMRVRQYSISSSPLWNAQHATLTISVVKGPTLSGREEEFLGVASNYLAHLRPGDRVHVAVRPSGVAFHPPTDPRTPIVMFCAGQSQLSRSSCSSLIKPLIQVPALLPCAALFKNGRRKNNLDGTFQKLFSSLAAARQTKTSCTLIPTLPIGRNWA